MLYALLLCAHAAEPFAPVTRAEVSLGAVMASTAGDNIYFDSGFVHEEDETIDEEAGLYREPVEVDLFALEWGLAGSAGLMHEASGVSLEGSVGLLLQAEAGGGNATPYGAAVPVMANLRWASSHVIAGSPLELGVGGGLQLTTVFYSGVPMWSMSSVSAAYAAPVALVEASINQTLSTGIRLMVQQDYLQELSGPLPETAFRQRMRAGESSSITFSRWGVQVFFSGRNTEEPENQ